MKNLRYFLIMLFLVPGYAYAQQDSVVVRVGDQEFPAYPATFGEFFEEGVTVGPNMLAAIEPAIGCEPSPDDPDVFIPAVENPEELEGNIALISRGACAFVLKAEAAISAGAIGYIVYNDDRVPPDNEDLVNMGGDCDAETCGLGVFVSRASGLALLVEEEFGSDALFDPILIVPPPPVPTFAVINTGTVATSIYDSGFFGDAPEAPESAGFTFGEDNGLFIGSVVLAQEEGNVVVGNPYGTASEFGVVREVGDCDDCNPLFDLTAEAELTATADEGDSIPVSFEYAALARTGDPYVFIALLLENTSGGDLSGIYASLFADFDAGDFAQNLGGYDEDTETLYVFDNSGTSTNYFGMTAVEGDVSGWTLATDAGATDASLYESITNGGGDELPEPQDARTLLGVGPFDFAPGESIEVAFALVAGENLDDLLENAAEARALIDVAAEETTPAGTYVLESAFPNPVSSRATIGFELPTAEDVTLKVYDVLGREVATLVEGVRQAGPQTVEFDVSSLPSGVYVYRLEAGSTQLTERITVVR